MNKNMYSLMLSQEVVSAIDKLAHESGTNRSSMINGILAEYVSYRTPEMRMQEMFETMERMLSSADGLKVMLRSSDSLFSLRSALAYKYNPTIQYNIQLYRSMSDSIGELRTSLRTQNSRLKLYILQFYKLWSRIESRYLGGNEYAIEGEKYTRRFVVHKDVLASTHMAEDELCEAIVDYVCAFDDAMKAFFYDLDDMSKAAAQVENIYRKYQAGSRVML